MMIKKREDKRKYYPLTHPQKRVYYDEKKYPGTGWTNIAFLVRYKEILNFDLLSRAINCAIKKNDGFRLRIVELDFDHEPLQYISPFKEISIDDKDFSGSGGERRLQEWLKKTSAEAFNLIDSDLFYFASIKFNEYESGYYFKFHHTISDGWTCLLTMTEINEIYEALNAGKNINDTPAPSYLQFIEDEKKYLNSGQIKKDREFWHNTLLPLPEPLDLSSKRGWHPQPLIASEVLEDIGKKFAKKTKFQKGLGLVKIGDPINIKADEMVIPITQNLRTMVHKYRETHKTSIYKLIFAAFSIYLSGVKRTDDIVIGGINHSRTRDIYREMIGMFVSTFPIRIKVDGNMTFKSFVEKIGKDINYILKNHQKYPFDLLGTELRKITHTDPHFLINMVIVGHTDVKKEEYSAKYCFPGFLPYPLVLHINPSNKDIEGILELVWNYQAEKFSRPDIRQIHQGLVSVLANALTNPMQKISGIELLSAEEKRKILDEFNDTQTDYPREKTIHELFEEQVDRTPDHIALVAQSAGRRAQRENKKRRTLCAGNCAITYRDLNAKANQLARELNGKGMKPGDIAAITVEPCQEMIIGMLGILEAGGAYLPIDPGYPEERINYVLADSGAKIILKDSYFTPKAFNNRRKGTSALLHLPPAPATSLAYVIYTSGSAGKPKGVLVEHRSLANLCSWYNRYFSVTSSDRATKYAAPGFDASVWEIFPHLLIGAALYILPEKVKADMEALNRYFETNNITISFLPTPVYQQFMSINNTSLRVLQTAGDKLQRFVKRNYRLYNCYGPTENTVCATGFHVTELSDNIPIGKPINNNQVYILDKNDNFQPIKVPGELCIAGESLARGYLNRPELTAEKFDHDFWNYQDYHDKKKEVKKTRKTYKEKNNQKFLRGGPGGAVFSKSAPPGRRRQKIYKTGDLACWLTDGNIEFLGRIDFQVKIRGYRIELGEIESQLVKIPGIKEALVIDRQDREGEKYLCAYITSDKEFAVKTVRNILEKELPGYMIPPHFIPIREIPLNPNGKLDRKALPPPDLEIVTGDYAAPTNEIEELAAKVWTEILDTKKVSIDDNFFEIGGDSIKAIQIAAKLQRHKLKLEVSQLFLHKTIREVVKFLQPISAGKFRTAEQTVTTGNVELTPIQKWFFENHLPYSHHFNQSVRLYRKEGFEQTFIKKIFTKIVEHHDALRMTYRFEENRVIQINRGINGKLFDLEMIQLAKEDKEEINAEIKHQTRRIQKRIDLKSGPLVKLALFKGNGNRNGNRGDYLSIIIHHSVVDGVSWRILLEDFETGYDQASKGKEIKFPAKSDSFKHWAQKLKDYSQSKSLLNQVSYWNTLEEIDIKPLPADHDIRKPRPRFRDSHMIPLELSSEKTHLLSTKVNRAYNTEINDILLTALGLAVKQWAGLDKVLINLEGHGRETIMENVDINRTVGWFTTQYPVILDIKKPGNISHAVKNVKETLRRVPGKGIGYGILKYLTPPGKKALLTFKHTPEILFNYLGTFGGETFTIIDTIAGLTDLDFEEDFSPDFLFTHKIDIEGIIDRGKLKLFLLYNTREYERETIEKLAEILKAQLEQVINHCAAKEEKELTPSDLGYNRLSLEGLKRIREHIKNNITADMEIQLMYPLSPMQAGMLYHALKNKEANAYFEQCVLPVHEEPDKALMEESLNRLIARHDILRTIFAYEELEEPVQIVLKKRKAQIFHEDITHLNEEEQLKYLEEFKKADKKTGFNLSRDLLIRLALFKIGGETGHTYYIVLSFHHILMDGWSLAIIFKELNRIYNSLKEGKAIELEPVIHYVEFIGWLQDQGKEEGLHYWEHYLQDYEEAAVLPGPGRMVRVKEAEYQLEEYRFIIDGTLTFEMEKICKDNQVTANTFFQTLWGILLQKYNNRSDVVFGAIVSGRAAAIEGIEGMVGLFINMIPVRVDSTGNPRFRQLLRNAQEKFAAGKSHEYLPVAEIQAKTSLKEALINHIMVFENYPLEEKIKNEEEKQLFHLKKIGISEQSNYDFNVMVIPGQHFTINFNYNGLVYDGDLVEHFSLHFKKVVRQVVENPDVDTREIEIITEEEKNKILFEFNDTRAGYPKDKTLHELFAAQVNRFPDHIAVCGAHQSHQSQEKAEKGTGEKETKEFAPLCITYKELDQQANRLTYLLAEKGVTPDTIFAILMERSIEMITAIIAIIKAGGAYLPINPKNPSDRIKYLLEDSRAKLLVTTRNFKENADGEKIYLPLDEEDACNLSSLNKHFPGPSPANLAYVISTSGSTGNPKFVPISHSNLSPLLHWGYEHLGLNRHDRVIQNLSYSFDWSVWEIFITLTSGAVLFSAGDDMLLNPEVMIDFTRKHGITVLHITPTQLQALITFAGSEPGQGETVKLETLKYLCIGAELLTYELLRRSFETVTGRCRVFNMYGPTEATIISAVLEIDRSNYQRFRSLPGVPIGTPVGNTTLLVMDKYLKLCPINIVGELYIGGDCLSSGYFNNQELTAQKFLLSPPYAPHSPLYQTGDLVRWLADGNIEYLGRIDHQVKIRGFRIEPGEIETQLMEHPLIKEAVVIDLEKQNQEKYLCAYYISKKEFTVTELRDYLSRRLPEYMIPSYFIRISRMPLTANGKIDKKAFPTPNRSRLKLQETYTPPGNEIEKIIIHSWKEILQIDRVGTHDRFFQLGGNSIDMIRLNGKLSNRLKRNIPIVAMFRHPTAASLARYLSEGEEGENSLKIGTGGHHDKGEEGERGAGLEIAVVGMAGTFPGAKNIDEFWENLKNGVETISFFSEEELKSLGIEEEWLEKPDFIKAKGFLKDIEYFDSSFFEYSARDAEVMEPQVRIFHQYAWEALENAGYTPDFYEGRIGLYAGASSNSHREMPSRLPQPVETDPASQYNASLLAERELLCVRSSYKLNLNGPAVLVQTACSTSLVAIDVACQGLLSGRCHMALAGGISITLPLKSGYIYQEGMVKSADGHCRAFDAKASGTVGGNGIGIVVLKRLKEAVDDGDTITAVIKGSAINNDGDRKVGFTAPSIEGQARVIQTALQVGGIEPESISYIETHGTGTPIGDPIEIEGLKLAFNNTGKKGFCALGSVKTNIGHLDAAAGVAGFIKTVLALKHRLIPPSLHFKTPNPKIDLENSPFYVNNELLEWKNDKYPLRAGVSSFGIGGTNAHVVLEEAPPPVIGNPSLVTGETGKEREYQLILLSAKTPAALDKMTENLAGYFRKNLLNPGNHKNWIHPGPTLADAAYTLQVGRKAFDHRQMLVCTDMNDAMAGLSSNPVKMKASMVKEEKRPVIFMFPGHGSQYVNMGVDIYKTEPYFREEMDHCFEMLKSLVDEDIKETLYPGISVIEKSSPVSSGPSCSTKSYMSNINQLEITLPLLFIFEYALAKLLMKWGISPYGMIGHSSGEYVAACISGVFSPEDALKLVISRGKLIQSIPSTGSMLSISISKKALAPLLKKHKELSLAAVNSTSICVVSGPTVSIENFEKELEEKAYQCKRLHTSHASHSKMVAPILETFEAMVKQIKLNSPRIPIISNVTGGWLAPEDAGTPAYWSRHLRRTVRFDEGIENLSKEENFIFLEVGPGNVLSTFLRKRAGKKPGQTIINLSRHPQEKAIDGDDGYLISKIGQLWLHGVDIDWREWTGNEKRRRIPLPTYPFAPRLYPVSNNGNPFKKAAAALLKEGEPIKKSNMADWFYVPLWEQTLLPCPGPVKTSGPINWLIFIDEKGLGIQLGEQLKKDEQKVTMVNIGTKFMSISDSEFTLHPSCADDYTALFKELRKLEKIPHKILHLWSISGDHRKDSLLEELDRDMDLGFYSLLHIVQAMGRESIVKEIEINVVTAGMQQVTGEEELRPQHAAILGAVKIIPLEYTNMKCRSIDIVLPAPGSQQENKLINLLEAEFQAPPRHPVEVAAYRGFHRWVRVIKPHPLYQAGEKELVKPLRQEGVYLVTGGLGGMGLTLAEYLAASVKARLILIGRSPFPGQEEWDRWLAVHGMDDSVSRKIIQVRHMQACGARVMIIRADVADYRQMREVIARGHEQFGPINGILHTAGVIDYHGVIQGRTREMTEEVMAPKVRGTSVLDRLFKNEALDFFILFSSLGNIVYKKGFGQMGYIAANEFLDAYSSYSNTVNNRLTTSINWNAWLNVGMAVEVVNRKGGEENANYETLFPDTLMPAQGVEVFKRILAAGLTNVAVCTKDLPLMIKRRNHPGTEELTVETQLTGKILEPSTALHQRPDIGATYVEPGDELEQSLAQIFSDFLGIQQVGVDDNFFDLGISSLDLVTITRRLKEVLDKKVPIVIMFTYPTIRTLAQYLTRGEETADDEKETAGKSKNKKVGQPEITKTPQNLLGNTINILRRPK